MRAALRAATIWRAGLDGLKKGRDGGENELLKLVRNVRDLTGWKILISFSINETDIKKKKKQLYVNEIE